MLGAARGMLLAAAFPFPLSFAPHTFSSHPYFAACEVHARASRQRIASPFPIGARCKANPSFSATASGIGLKRSKKGSLAQVPLPILFRTLPRPSLRCDFVLRNGDASPASPLFRPRRSARPYKSLFLRQTTPRLNFGENTMQYVFINGVAGIVAMRQKEPKVTRTTTMFTKRTADLQNCNNAKTSNGFSVARFLLRFQLILIFFF